jgi:hypothetical protein
MRAGAVEQGYIERDAALGKILPYFAGEFSGAGRYFEEGKAASVAGAGDALDQGLRGGDAAKPAVDHAHIPHGHGDIGERAGIGIENLGAVDAQHGRRIAIGS